MSLPGRIGRAILIFLGALIAAVLVAGVGFIGAGEWKYRSAASAPLGGVTITPVLILLHGAGLSGRMWDPVRRGLDPRNRVIALDLPGHGVRREEKFTLDGTAAVVAAAAQSVAPAPVILVGDSLGGYSAIAAAASIPKSQLRGLVIAGAAANFENADYFRYMRDVTIIGILATFIDETEFISKRLYKFGVAEKDARAMTAGGLSARAVPAAVRAMIGVDFREKLAAVTVPVLFVNGSLDTRKRLQEAEFLAAAKNGSVHIIENSEHGVSMRRSAEFARIVNEFAARVVAPALPGVVKQ
jgi:pimeloyl-ACP methyl ester carboxylesterase